MVMVGVRAVLRLPRFVWHILAGVLIILYQQYRYGQK